MVTEYFTEAVVLDKESVGEFDSRVFLYTKELGLVSAFVTSARKIISKLNGHLEPLNIVQVRLVEKKRLQVADVLKINFLPKEKLFVLNLIKDLSPEFQPDEELWQAVFSDFSKDRVLQLLGFDRKFASCHHCGLKNDLQFITSDPAYFCFNCRMAKSRFS